MNQCYLDFMGFALANLTNLLLILIIEILLYLHLIYKLSLSVVIFGTCTYIYIYAYVQHVGACMDIVGMLGESLPFLMVEVRVFSFVISMFSFKTGVGDLGSNFISGEE